MDLRVNPTPRIEPLPPEHSPDLKDELETLRTSLGFIPNSVLIMQRKPAMVRAFVQMLRAIWSPDSTVDRGLKRRNDTLATPLEDEPVAVGEAYLARGGWSAGKHRQ